MAKCLVSRKMAFKDMNNGYIESFYNKVWEIVDEVQWITCT